MLTDTTDNKPAGIGWIWPNPYLIFATVLLFALCLALFSVFSYVNGDQRSALVFCLIAVALLVGMAVQAVMGTPYWLRAYYCLCALVYFLFLVLGGGDGAILLGPLAIVPGLVMLLGYRHATLLLLVMLCMVGAGFYLDLRWPGLPGYGYWAKISFVFTFFGLGLFSVGLDFCREKTQQALAGRIRQIRELAYRDEMTGLANRRAMAELLQKRWEELQRGGQTFSVLLCDVDRLKDINDQFGHELGDMVMARVANVIHRGLRAQDTVARWNDDELLVLLPGQSHTTALKVAERLRKRVEAVEMALKNRRLPVTVSIGVAGVANALDVDDLLRLVDGALYQAKHMGRNQVVLG